jgi:Putative zinc-finger
MTHPTEETLNDYIERELSPAEHVQVATHLDTCRDCALVVAEIQQIVREASALGPITPPPHVWAQLQGRLAESSVVSAQSKAGIQKSEAWPRVAWALATAALVVMAFLTGRFVNLRDQQRAPESASATAPAPAARVADEATVRERVLLIAVGDHLERSQMVLVELAHADTSGELDISAERQLADDLVASNRLYRQTARQMGHANVAGLLDELERVLVEVARGPSTMTMPQLADIQQRIESQGILFKVKVIRSEIRQQPVS